MNDAEFKITAETEKQPAHVIAWVTDYALGIIFMEALKEATPLKIEGDIASIRKFKKLDPDDICVNTQNGWAIYRIRPVD